jgi:hypothetical protein
MERPKILPLVAGIMLFLCLLSILGYGIWTGFQWRQERQIELNWSLWRAVDRSEITEAHPMLDAGADPNFCPISGYDQREGQSLLLMAIYRHAPDVVEELIKYGADVNAVYARESMLKAARRAALIEPTDSDPIVQLLKRAGAEE